MFIFIFQEQKISADIKIKVKLTETRSSYVIPSVEESDTGRYFCKVTNSLGIEEAFADLNVLGKMIRTNYHI